MGRDFWRRARTFIQNHYCQSSFLAQNAPKIVWSPGSARTRWGAYKRSSIAHSHSGCGRFSARKAKISSILIASPTGFNHKSNHGHIIVAINYANSALSNAHMSIKNVKIRPLNRHPQKNLPPAAPSKYFHPPFQNHGSATVSITLFHSRCLSIAFGLLNAFNLAIVVIIAKLRLF